MITQLFYRLPLILRMGLFILLVCLLMSALSYPFFRGLVDANARAAVSLRGSSLSELLSLTMAHALEESDAVDPNAALRTLSRDPFLSRIVVFEANGEILARYPLDAVIEDLTIQQGSGPVGEARYGVWRPVVLDRIQVGSLYVELNVPLEQVRLQTLTYLAAFSLIMSVALTLVLNAWSQRALGQPISQLVAASRRIADGHYDVSFEPNKYGVLEELNSEFGAMIHALKSAAGSRTEAESVLQCMEGAVFLIDCSDQIVASNPAARALLGYDEQELTGMPAAYCMDFPREIGAPAAPIRQRVLVDSGECVLLSRDGGRVPVVFSGAALERGPEARTIVAAHDISQRIRQEDYLRQTAARAEQANRAKSQFLAKMSHELRTPLNAILGFAQIQKARLTEDSPDYLVKNTEHTLSAGWHLLNLINDVLDISRIEENNLKLSMEECKLGEVVSHSRSLVLADAREADVSLEIEDSPLLAMADYTRLKQVLVNLFNNAIKYNRPGGRVTFSASQRADGMIECRIEDTGVGIRLEDSDAVFEPFTRLHHAESNAIAGTGIGLALTRLLVELMGGSIRFSSEPGVGTTFYLELKPAASQRLPHSDAVLKNADSLSLAGEAQMTVIYVEDNAASLELMKAIMDPMPQVTLLTSTVAEEGISLAHKHQPDLIILDINLPGGMDGVVAARVIRDVPELSGIRLIALSADATEVGIEKALAAGFDEYLTKPLDIDKLLRLMNELQGRRRASTPV